MRGIEAVSGNSGWVNCLFYVISEIKSY